MNIYFQIALWVTFAISAGGWLIGIGFLIYLSTIDVRKARPASRALLQRKKDKAFADVVRMTTIYFIIACVCAGILTQWG